MSVLSVADGRSRVIADDGETSAVIRSVHWGATSLGESDTWPNYLTSALSIVLSSGFPMCLFWGADLFSFYNDAFARLVGHPDHYIPLAGRPAAIVFPELWNRWKPYVEVVKNKDKTLLRESHEFSFSEDKPGNDRFAACSYSYSPVKNESGEVEGVLMMCVETARPGRFLQYEHEKGDSLLLTNAIETDTRKSDEEKIALLAAIVESSNDAIITKNLNGIITSWNDAAYRIFGYLPEEIVGKHITTLIPSDRMDEEKDIISRIVKDERIEHFETQRIAKNKAILDISLTISALKDHRGKVIGASKIARNITEQRKHEKLIAESEQKFRLLSDSMPQFIWTADPSGNLNYFNASVYRYSGLTPEEVHEHGWLQIVHPGDRGENINQWMHSIMSGDPFLFEHRFRRHDGEYRWQLSRALPQKDASGNIQMWVGTSTDIHEIKKLEQQKDDFIKMASHELKTPVTTIKGYIQLLLKTHGDKGDAFLAGLLSTIDKQVSKLTTLITDLLDLTKIETGSLELNREVMPLGRVVQETIKDMHAAAHTHAISLRSYADPLVFADRNRIEQVLINFLTNAVKYSPKADKIQVEIKREGSFAVISVQDFGIGIARAEHQRIFERFYRVAGKDEKTFPGFGIGLFIVNEIVTLHGGKIWVESEKDKGSIFYFSLPVHE